MSGGDSGQVVHLDAHKQPRPADTPVEDTNAPVAERLESPPPAAPAPPETLSQRLDHALGEIKRLMQAERTRGPY